MRDHNEKFAIAEFARFTVPDPGDGAMDGLQAFIDEHRHVVLKRLDGMGGAGIFVVRQDDPNRNVIVETISEFGRRSVMAQRYIPEISKGDKRVLLIDGKVVPYCLARIPKAGESRGNLAAGGRGVAQPVGARDREIAESPGADAGGARPAAGGSGRDRRLADRGQRHQPDLLPRDPGPDRLRRRRHLHRGAGAQARMIGILIVTHGTIGESLLASAQHILDRTPEQTATLGVSRLDDPDMLILRAQELLHALDGGDGVLVLTDIFGATPCNVVTRAAGDGRVEGVSGLSLPMLLRVLTSRNGSLKGAVQRALSGGAEGVVHMNTDRCCDA